MKASVVASAVVQGLCHQLLVLETCEKDRSSSKTSNTIVVFNSFRKGILARNQWLKPLESKYHTTSIVRLVGLMRTEKARY